MDSSINFHAQLLLQFLHPYAEWSEGFVNYRGAVKTLAQWSKYETLKEYSLQQLREIGYLILAHQSYSKLFDKRFRAILKFLDNEYLISQQKGQAKGWFS